MLPLTRLSSITCNNYLLSGRYILSRSGLSVTTSQRCALTRNSTTAPFCLSHFRPLPRRNIAVCMAEKYKVVFVLGAPGSGKGTQCSLISSQLNWCHLSAGDLLRAEQSRPNSKYGALIDEHIRNGTIVPVEITCSLLENAMREASAKGDPKPSGFLIDGFPRNQNNLEGWRAQMCDSANVVAVLFIECDEETCQQRILGRSQGRADDNVESLRKRRITYTEQTMPVVSQYAELGIVRKVDGSKDSKEVFEDVKSIFAVL